MELYGIKYYLSTTKLLHIFLEHKSGPDRLTATMSICNTFKCIFIPEIIDIIVHHTKVRSLYQPFNEKNLTKPLNWKELTPTELYAFLGVLTSGASNSNTDHVFDLFKCNSYPLYQATMGHNKFANIIFLHFDDANTRQHSQDKAAPINEIWMMLKLNFWRCTDPLHT